MTKLKIITCILVNLVLFYLLVEGFNEITNNKEIIKTNKPIAVKIIDINYGYKSRTTCDVEFDNKIYKKVSYPFNDHKIGSNNDKDFYYNKTNDTIFLKNQGKFALKVLIILFVLSLLLWFVPSSKYKI